MPHSRPNEVLFHSITGEEHQQSASGGVKPRHLHFSCGACGKDVHGRVVCSMLRGADNHEVAWCLCTCERSEPTVLILHGEKKTFQAPISRAFHAHEKWPPELSKLYEEAAMAYSAGAFTACALVCRKVLM